MNDDIPKDLSGVPPQMIPARPASGASDQTSAPPPQPPRSDVPPPVSSSFDFNQPTVISLIYLSGFLLGITWIVGVVLAYIWKSEPKAAWEASHYDYHIRTFWIGFLGTIISVILMIVLIGFLLWAAVAVLVVVRCVFSLINAQKQEPVPNPDTWLA